MKRFLTILMVLAMLLSLCACGGGEPIRGEQIAGDTQPATEGADFSLGSTSGATYENSFIGIGCNLPEGWTFYTDDQIRELNNMTADVAGEEFQQMMEQATIIYDMYATAADGMSNMNVNLEKVPQLQLLVLDLEDNMEKIAPSLKETMEGMGFADYTYEIGTVEIEGESFVCMNSHATISGLDMYQLLISIKCNGYLANVSVTSFVDDLIDEILTGFYLA